MPRNAAPPLTSAEAAAAIAKLARERGIDGPPYTASDWAKLAEEVGWLVRPTPDPELAIEWSRETRELEERLAELNARIAAAVVERDQAETAAAMRQRWDSLTGELELVPRDPAAAERLERAGDELERLEREHVLTVRELSRSRARDMRRHDLKRRGVLGKIAAAVS